MGNKPVFRTQTTVVGGNVPAKQEPAWIAKFERTLKDGWNRLTPESQKEALALLEDAKAPYMTEFAADRECYMPPSVVFENRLAENGRSLVQQNAAFERRAEAVRQSIASDPRFVPAPAICLAPPDKK